MRYVIASVAALGLAAFVAAQSPAGAQNQAGNAAPGASQLAGMTIGAVVGKLESQGYAVRAIELDDGVYEVKVVDRQGQRLKADLNPATAEPVTGWKKNN